MARSMGDLLHPNDPRDAARALRSSSGGGVAAGEGGGGAGGARTLHIPQTSRVIFICVITCTH